jgi:membrane protease YdiL (CAAX protease family)
MFLAMLAGPTLASLLLTFLVDGKPGFREMLSRFLKVRIGAHWYAIALLTAPVLMLATLLGLSSISFAFLPSVFTPGFEVSLLYVGIVYGIITGFFEELGWTGFAIPRLRSKYSSLSTGVIVGAVWGVWHFPLFLSKDPAGVVPLAVLLLVRLFTHLPAFRVLMVWVYDRTGSLSLAMLMHAGLTASSLIIQPQSTAGVHIITANIVVAAVLWCIIGVISVTNKARYPQDIGRNPATLKR